jgi:hypothetical protein
MLQGPCLGCLPQLVRAGEVSQCAALLVLAAALESQQLKEPVDQSEYTSQPTGTHVQILVLLPLMPSPRRQHQMLPLHEGLGFLHL